MIATALASNPQKAGDQLEPTGKKESQNGSVKVEKFAIFVQSDSRVRQCKISANAFSIQQLAAPKPIGGGRAQSKDTEKAEPTVHLKDCGQ